MMLATLENNHPETTSNMAALYGSQGQYDKALWQGSDDQAGHAWGPSEHCSHLQRHGC